MTAPIFSSLYINLRCPNCELSQTYANVAEPTIVCDFCAFTMNKEPIQLSNRQIGMRQRRNKQDAPIFRRLFQ